LPGSRSAPGKRLAFASDHFGPYNIFSQANQGVGTAQRLTASHRRQYPKDWSPDGRWLVFEEELARPAWLQAWILAVRALCRLVTLDEL
jgi:Tol biopolymer transport system component